MKTNPLISCVAIAILSATVAIGQTGLDESYREHPLLLMADSLFRLQQLDTAVKFYRNAEVAFRKEQKWDSYVFTLNQIAGCEQERGNQALALQNLSLSSGLVSKWLDSLHPEIARYHFFMAECIANENLDSSLFDRESALEIRQTIWSEPHPDLALSYRQIGDFYTRKRDFDKALLNYNKALEIQEQILDSTDLELAWTLRQIGSVYHRKEEVADASGFLHEAVRLFEIHKIVPLIRKSLLYNSLANNYHHQKKFKKAVPYYRQSLQASAESEDFTMSSYLVTMGNLALTLSELKQFDSASIVFHKVLEINLQSENPDNTNLANCYQQLGESLLDQGLPDSAIICFNRSLDYHNRVPQPDTINQSNVLASLGRAFLRIDQLHSAREVTNQALQLITSNWGKTEVFDFEMITTIDDFWEPLGQLVEIEFTSFQKTNILADLDRAIKYSQLMSMFSEHVRNGQFSQATKMIVSGQFKESAASALRCIKHRFEISSDDYLVHLSFDLMERNRYAQLFSHISLIDQPLLPNILLEEEQTLVSSLAEQELRLSNADSLEKSLLQSQLLDIRRNIIAFRRELASRYPSYYLVNYDSMYSLDEIQSRLQPGEQILEYFWGDSSISVIDISPERAALDFIPMDEPMSKHLQWLLLRTSQNGFPDSIEMDESYEKFQTIAHELYQVLIHPYLSSETRKLILSPDGDLALLPFEILVTDKKKSDFRTASYLFRGLPVQYIYSSNLLYRGTEASPLRRPSLLAFAYSDSRSELLRKEEGLWDLPASEDEVRSIRKVFRGGRERIFTGLDASEANFKEHAPNFNIIHLAVHGIGDKLNDLESRIEFRKSGDNTDDGRLYAHELYTQNLLKLRLAVLSACETGIGRELAGEGIFSIARGFAYAGCPSLVMSLWNVTDMTTSKLMEFFYENLSLGMELSKAMQLAKLRFLEEAEYDHQASPFFWAAFLTLGDDAPVMTDRNHGYLFLLGAAVGLLFIYLTWSRQKNQRKSS